MENSPIESDSQPAVELQRVGVLAGGRWIIDEVQLRLPQGVCCALLGPNGCGKSTLARVLAGFVWPTRGKVVVLGETFGDTDLHALRQRVKLVQANNTVEHEPDMPAFDVVLTGAFGTILLFDPPTDEHRKRASELMQRLGIAQLARSRFGSLSTGERMRLLIARALLITPALLILDEATAGLDLSGRELLLRGLDDVMAQPAGRPTILMISHHVEEIPSCTDWAILMSGGKITAAGPVGTVVAAAPMSIAFGERVRVDRVAGRFTARIEAQGL